MGRWDGLNRRKFPRVSFPCLVVIRDANGDKEMVLAHTENIGVGGLCIIVKQDLKMFSTVELEIDLLDMQEHIKCSGKVVWNVQRKTSEKRKPKFYDLGIEFEDIGKKAHEQLQKVVTRLVANDMEV